MRPKINPAVLALLTAQMLMEPSALARMQQSLLALPAGIDLSVKYAPRAGQYHYAPVAHPYGGHGLGRPVQSLPIRSLPTADLFDGGDDDDSPKPRKPYEMAGGVAVIRLSGVLQKDPSWLMRYYGGTSTRAFIAMLALAEGDPDVSKICVLADSPGGDVDGTADAADAVYAVRQRGKKDIVAAVDGVCCSACYWVASQASKVYCGQTSVVGSIGTRWRLLDTSGYYEQMGIKAVEVTTGTYKAAGADGLPVTADDRAYFQGIVDDMQARFSAGIVRGRRLSADAVRALAADAKIYVGKAAQDAGLVDDILPVRDVIRQLQKGAASGGAGQSASILQDALILQAATSGTTASGQKTTGGKGTGMAENNKKGFKSAFTEFMAKFGDEDDSAEAETDPGALQARVSALTADKARLEGEKAGLTAQVQSLSADRDALADEKAGLTARHDGLTAQHAALAERVKGIDEAEATAQAQALDEARAAASAAATTAFGAGSAELEQALALIGAQAGAGVLASMTAAYKAAAPKTLRPGAARQTAVTKVVTAEDPTPEQTAAAQARADALDPQKVYAKRRSRAA